jgi:hypothetical protein
VVTSKLANTSAVKNLRMFLVSAFVSLWLIG